MTDRPKAIVFDADPATLAAIQQAFPGWEIESISGATPGSLIRDWDPGPAELLIACARDVNSGALGLCRGLRSQAGRTLTPLLVIVTPADEVLVKAALEAGADSCLVLPVHAKDFVKTLRHMRLGNQPGRHTLSLDRAQRRDDWRDDGGEA
jgi:DNA-binding response OmpR family regulator